MNSKQKIISRIICLILIFAAAMTWLASDKLTVSLKYLVAGVLIACAAFLDFLRSVWGDHLKKVWAKNLAGYIDSEIRYYLSGFWRNYRQQIEYRCRFVNVKGLITHNAFTLKLEHVFVELRIAPTDPNSLSRTPLNNSIANNNIGIWDLLKVSDHSEQSCLTITGLPGCGKTTLIQHLALIYARNQQSRFSDGARIPPKIPILLYLREQVDSILDSSSINLAELVTRDEKKRGSSPPANWFHRKLINGQCLVLLDGLDEVADVTKQKSISEWLEQQKLIYGKSLFIVTSRPHGVKSTEITGMLLEVQPLTREKTRLLIRNWYTANEVMRSQIDDPGVRYDALEKANDLIDRISRNPSLMALAVNPLLLTMMATVHNFRGHLPGRRVDLYREITLVLLSHWQAAKKLTSRLSIDQKLSVIKQLALFMMSSELREITIYRAESVIEPYLKRLTSEHMAPREFLKEIEESTSLIIEREIEVLSFSHLTLQEFLAASEVSESLGVEYLVERLENPWWHETIRLYASMNDATRLVTKALKVAGDRTGEQKVRILSLAHDCAEEGKVVDIETRRELDEKILGDLDSSSAEIARIAYEVILTRRLQKLCSADSGTFVDSSYITHAEYFLFIEAERKVGRDRRPCHWNDWKLGRTKAKAPVVGLTYVDARDFSKWLSTLYGRNRVKLRLLNNHGLEHDEFGGVAGGIRGPDNVHDSSRMQGRLFSWFAGGAIGTDRDLHRLWGDACFDMAASPADSAPKESSSKEKSKRSLLYRSVQESVKRGLIGGICIDLVFHINGNVLDDIETRAGFNERVEDLHAKVFRRVEKIVEMVSELLKSCEEFMVFMNNFEGLPASMDETLEMLEKQHAGSRFASRRKLIKTLESLAGGSTVDKHLRPVINARRIITWEIEEVFPTLVGLIESATHFRDMELHELEETKLAIELFTKEIRRVALKTPEGDSNSIYYCTVLQLQSIVLLCRILLFINPSTGRSLGKTVSRMAASYYDFYVSGAVLLHASKQKNRTVYETESPDGVSLPESFLEAIGQVLLLRARMQGQIRSWESIRLVADSST